MGVNRLAMGCPVIPSYVVYGGSKFIHDRLEVKLSISIHTEIFHIFSHTVLPFTFTSICTFCFGYVNVKLRMGSLLNVVNEELLSGLRHCAMLSVMLSVMSVMNVVSVYAYIHCGILSVVRVHTSLHSGMQCVVMVRTYPCIPRHTDGQWNCVVCQDLFHSLVLILCEDDEIDASVDYTWMLPT